MIDKKIKVLIVEDSLVTRKLLEGLVHSDERFELIGIADNGKLACEFVKKLTPDVISMDIMMPVLDGLDATRQIMEENPAPIVIVSSFYQSSEVEMAIKVLEAGAVTILPRPYGPGHPKYLRAARQYLNTLKAMSEVKVVRRRIREKSGTIPDFNRVAPYLPVEMVYQEYKVLAIGASAGGPEGLMEILSGLPSDFPLPVLIVQHIDGHFAEGFVSWLNTKAKLPVTIAVNGEKIQPGHVYLPPGDLHLIVNRSGQIITPKEPYSGSLRPSVAMLFNSVANVYGKNTIAVLLSGMGKDGASELKQLFDLGAFTIAQEEASCLVYGMPGEAVKIGAACKILPPKHILSEIIGIINLQSGNV